MVVYISTKLADKNKRCALDDIVHTSNEHFLVYFIACVYYRCLIVLHCRCMPNFTVFCNLYSATVKYAVYIVCMHICNLYMYSVLPRAVRKCAIIYLLCSVPALVNKRFHLPHICYWCCLLSAARNTYITCATVYFSFCTATLISCLILLVQ